LLPRLASSAGKRHRVQASSSPDYSNAPVQYRFDGQESTGLSTRTMALGPTCTASHAARCRIDSKATVAKSLPEQGKLLDPMSWAGLQPTIAALYFSARVGKCRFAWSEVRVGRREMNDGRAVATTAISRAKAL
jgi:hypothetical protein